MKATAQFNDKKIADLQAQVAGQVERIHEYFEMIERGEDVSLASLLELKNLREIKTEVAKLPPRLRPDLSAEEIEWRDRFIHQHVIKELLYDLEKGGGSLERTAVYTRIINSLQKYEQTPTGYLLGCYLDDKDYQEQAQIFRDGAITYTNEWLRTYFETASLSEEDAALLRNESAPANDRLNALLRPMTGEQAKPLLDILEQALKTTEADPDLADYIDELIPENVYFNTSDAPAVKTLSALDERARKAIEKAVTRVARASSLEGRTRNYVDLRAELNMHRKDVDWFIGTLKYDAARDRARQIIQEAALVYVGLNFRNTIKVKPSPEDQLIVDDPNARPGDQLNALFRNVADKATLDLLGALEDAGFDYEEADLTQRILAVGKPVSVAGLAMENK